MAEIDLRGILVALAEKNWVVYEEDESKEAPPTWKPFRGPVDNLRYGARYRVLPAAEDPADIEATSQELNDMATYGNILPAFKMPDGDVVDAPFFTLSQSQFLAPIASGAGRKIPIGEVEGLIREHFTTYDREETKKRVGKAVREAEEMRQRRSQRRRQNDEGYLQSWVDSVTGGQDE